MPESAPSRGRTSPQRSTGPARDSGRSTGSGQVQVRYYRRMRPNRVYPVVVSWRESGRGPGPVVVRLLMAGAQVVPAEQTLDPANPDDRATFYVTPLARGWLRGERLEVLQNGRKVQEIRLPCKVTTQWLTWVLLLLTIVVGWWVVPLLVEPIREAEPPNVPEVKERFKDFPPDVQRLYPYLYQLTHLDERLEFEPDKKAIVSHIKREARPVLPAIREYLPQVADKLEETPDLLGSSLYLVQDYQINHKWPIAEGLMGLLILLTVLSWFGHLERRKSRVGRALPAASGEEGA
jgi:hypothetical protein